MPGLTRMVDDPHAHLPNVLSLSQQSNMSPMCILFCSGRSWLALGRAPACGLVGALAGLFLCGPFQRFPCPSQPVPDPSNGSFGRCSFAWRCAAIDGQVLQCTEAAAQGVAHSAGHGQAFGVLRCSSAARLRVFLGAVREGSRYL